MPRIVYSPTQRETGFITDVVAAACRLFDGFSAGTDLHPKDADSGEHIFAQCRVLALRLAALTMAANRNLLPPDRQVLMAHAMGPAATSQSAPCLFAEILVPELDVWRGDRQRLLHSLNTLAAHEQVEQLPVEVLGRAYQALLDVHPTSDDFGNSKQARKAAGKFYTPPCLVNYIVRNTVGVIIEELARGAQSCDIPDKLLSIRALDPSAGSGDFLLATARLIGDSIADLTGSDQALWRQAAAQQCVYGMDFDPTAVALAKTALWLDCGLPGEDFRTSNNIRFADTLRDIRLPDGISGFDAVIGNPPYVASKNEDITAYREAYDFKGQCDYYLLFLENLTRDGVVRPNGYFSMVLPDPFIVRGNAAPARRRLTEDWTMETLLHIRGMFPGAGVSNAVPVCRRQKSSSYGITVKRVDSSRTARIFTGGGSLDGAEEYQVSSDFVLAQPGTEILYLTDKKATLQEAPVFRQLGQMDVEIGRGEEIGKRHLSSNEGELPVLLGGQSIRPFRIEWEGRRMDLARVKKPMGRYLTDKLLIQKSAGKLIAALDETTDVHPGFIVPQSIYCIRSGSRGPDLQYLLAIFNSSFMNDYVFRMFTGYKLIQPQIEIEDLKRLPIRDIKFSEDAGARRSEVVRIWPAQRSDMDSIPAIAREWLNEDREDLLHDLIVAISRDVVAMESAGPDRETLIGMLDRLVSLLYD